MMGAQLLQQLQPVHLRHHQIDHCHVHALALEQGERGRAVFHRDRIHAARGQHAHHAAAQRGLVIDDENAGCTGFGKAHWGSVGGCVCQVDHGFLGARQRRIVASVKQHEVTRETFLANERVIFPDAACRHKIAVAVAYGRQACTAAMAKHVELEKPVS
jgi:hypothetical protein